MLARNLICETTYKTHGGDFLDGSFYQEQSIPRGRRVKHRVSSEAQKRLNEDNARRHAVRLVQHNFRAGKDFRVDITYGDKYLPTDDDRQRKDIRNFLSRVKRLYKRLGINGEFKYFGTAVGGKGSRKHAHFIITGNMYPNLADEISALWPYGWCNADRLKIDIDNGLIELVNYILGNSQDSHDDGEKIYSKRWCASRNLVNPEPHQRRGKTSRGFLVKLALSSEFDRRELLEVKYPGYKAVEIRVAEIKDAPDDRKYRIFGNYYVYFRMRKYTEKELKIKQKEQRKKERQQRGEI